MPTEKPDECESCGFKTPELRDFIEQAWEARDKVGRSHWYCTLCSGTYTSRGDRSGFDSNTLQIMKTVCFVGNAIIAELKKRS